MANKLQRYKPIRQGSIYCSPFCGRKCTWDEFQVAKQDAKKLTASLGKGWKSNVWENLGWHYSVISPCGRIKVHKEHEYQDYFAFLGEPDSPGGRWSADGKTAREAIRAVIAMAKAELKEINAHLAGLPNF